jgi:hypothetical protein
LIGTEFRMTLSGSSNSAEPGLGDIQPWTHDDEAAPDVGSGPDGLAGGVGEAAEGDADVETVAVGDDEVGAVDWVSATLLEVQAPRARAQIAR